MDFMSRRAELFCKNAADKSRCPCDEILHACMFLLSTEMVTVKMIVHYEM